MFMIDDRRFGIRNFVFTHTDPRLEAYKGEVSEGVILDYDMNAIHIWPDGEPRPNPCLGRDPVDVKHYKVFRSPETLKEAGFELVHSNAPIICYSWLDYRKMFPVPAELAEKLGQEEWFEYLDEVDEATKRRRLKNVEPEPPTGSDRDRIAEWVARRHLSADGSIRQVLYLPAGAPAEEIRFLEVNERISTSNGHAEPIDFGIEVSGKSLKLFVADITSDQLEKMKRDPSVLPSGWRLDGARSWGLRA